jgi:copper/silver efflux system protein
LMVMASLPFALIGGYWAVYLAGYHMSVAVAVGLIALAGLAVETAIIMLLYLDQQVRTNKPETADEFITAVTQGALQRVRPKLMTVFVIIGGLSPVFFTDGLGADVMRRIAMPMLGGMVSTTLLTLVVMPVIYTLWVGKKR